MSESQNKNAAHEIHLSIAEAGKVFALKGKHDEALRHYREALKLATSAKAPEVFFRHYTQCVLESLELSGSYDEIIQFCQDADQHYASLALANSSLHQRDHGTFLERLGLVQVKSGDVDGGRESLLKAIETAGKGKLPVSEEVLGWLQRGYSLDAARITQSQRRHKYFVVRPEQVDESRAKPLAPQGKKSQLNQAEVLMG